MVLFILPVLHDHGHTNIDMTQIWNKFLKIHTTRVSDTCLAQHGSMIWVSMLHSLLPVHQGSSLLTTTKGIICLIRSFGYNLIIRNGENSIGIFPDNWPACGGSGRTFLSDYKGALKGLDTPESNRKEKKKLKEALSICLHRYNLTTSTFYLSVPSSSYSHI